MEIATRLPTDTAAADHVIVPPVTNLQSHNPVVPDGCWNVGPMTNCIATNTATTISATAKLSKSMFIGVLMDLFKRITRITRVLPARSIKTMIQNATLRQLYFSFYSLRKEKAYILKQDGKNPAKKKKRRGEWGGLLAASCWSSWVRVLSCEDTSYYINQQIVVFLKELFNNFVWIP